MTDRPNFKQLRDYKGPIYVGMLIRNDVIYIQAKKGDLLAALLDTDDAAIEIFFNGDGDLCVTSGS